jgi:hypothetical protein
MYVNDPHADIRVSGAVFSSQLRAQIEILAPDLPTDVVQIVLSSVKAVVALPPLEQAAILTAYSNAISRVFLIGVPAAALASASVLLVSRRKTSTPTVFEMESSSGN